MRKVALFAGIVALVATTSMAGVTGISSILKKSGLSPDDFAIAQKAAEKLYRAQAPRKGANTSWQNPDSGSYGTVEVAGVQDGCAFLRHIAHPKGREEGREFRTRWCKTSDGGWILS